MKSYKTEYTCIIYCLTIFDEDASWEEILIENDFNYNEAIKVLIQRIEKKIKSKISEKDKSKCDMYKLFLEKAQEICF